MKVYTVSKATPYLADFLVDGYVKRRQVVLVFDDQLGVLAKQQSEAFNVAVFAAEVARRVPVDVLSIQVYLLLDERLDDVEVATDARHVQRRAQVFRPAVQVTPEVCKHFNQLNVALVGGHVHRGPAVAVALVKERLRELAVLLAEKHNARVVVAFFCANPDASQELPLLAALLLLNLLLGEGGLLRLPLLCRLDDFYS